MLLLCLPLAACTEEVVDTGPTAIVIDNATGQPVEGAVALAQWLSAGGGGLFEGGGDVVDKTKEVFSDKDGKLYIKDFWKKGVFSGSTRLSVYKSGYVLWDSRRICPDLKGRTDFDENHRTVRLLKFDTEASRWIKEYPNRALGQPRAMQDTCYFECTMNTNSNNNVNFAVIFRKYELPLLNAEELLRRKKEQSK
jgi:hypothetical protein